MKILYVGNFDQPHRTEVYIKHALEELGHTVLTLEGKFVGSNRLLNPLLNGVDFVLFGKTGSPEILRAIYSLNIKKIKTVCWIHDLYGIPSRKKLPPEFQCDLVFSTDGGKEFKGINHQVLRQGIHLPDVKPLTSPIDIDYPIVFVGHDNDRFQPGRGTLVDFLRTEYGDQFTHLTNTRGDELTQILSTSGVVVGDSYPSERYWSNRIYEVTGRGGFLLHPETVGLEEEFVNDTHYVSWTRGDFSELGGLIDYYLENEEEREFIRLSGHSFTTSKYTYENRCESLIERVQETL